MPTKSHANCAESTPFGISDVAIAPWTRSTRVLRQCPSAAATATRTGPEPPLYVYSNIANAMGQAPGRPARLVQLIQSLRYRVSCATPENSSAADPKQAPLQSSMARSTMAHFRVSMLEKCATIPLLERFARRATAPNVTLKSPLVDARFNPSWRIRSLADGWLTSVS